MKNTIGNSVCLTLFGESHGSEIGAVLDGLAPGITLDEAFIRHCLSLRRPSGDISTPRQEADEYRIVSGVKDGVTTGAPLTILIPNADTRSADYREIETLARPSHADYAAYQKYHGFEDSRGGGHFSGRLTAPVVAAGAIALTALHGRGIRVGTHICRLNGVCDRAFVDCESDIETLAARQFPVLDDTVADEMRARIAEARLDGDSVGGVLETVVTGLPAGIGEPWFDSMEGVLARALFAIPAVKGVEFGEGFAIADMRGSEANDPWRQSGDGAMTLTNHSGGINGGITNGMPVLFRTAVKPTPTIAREQLTVNYRTGENATIAARGRHDPAIVHRARAVVDALTAIVLCDCLAGRYGTDYLTEK